MQRNIMYVHSHDNIDNMGKSNMINICIARD